jgi:hypothetical protein
LTYPANSNPRLSLLKRPSHNTSEIASTLNTTVSRTSSHASIEKGSEKQKHLRAVRNAEHSDVQSKPKRLRFSPKHKDDGRRLADMLRQQREVFPAFRSQLDELINRVSVHARRTRLVDRNKVIRLLTEWEDGLTRSEIVEDTRLSDWDVRQIAKDLIKAGRIVAHRRLRAGTHSKQWCVIYKLR